MHFGWTEAFDGTPYQHIRDTLERPRREEATFFCIDRYRDAALPLRDPAQRWSRSGQAGRKTRTAAEFCRFGHAAASFRCFASGRAKLHAILPNGDHV